MLSFKLIQTTTSISAIRYQDRWDSLIQYHAHKLSGIYESLDHKTKIEVNVPWKLIKAQIKQESGFNPLAQSDVGAKGLIQLMPATDLEIDNKTDGFNPDGNVSNGIQYLIEQYIHFPEIWEVTGGLQERWKFALGAYNGGRGTINAALTLARKAREQRWNCWNTASDYLAHPDCTVNGVHADHKQIQNYVSVIWESFCLNNF